MAEFKVGDTVKLRSGGPLMTIYAIDSDEISCQWFNNDEIKGATFNSEVLIFHAPVKLGSVL
jgi:uncharacterized protein YodC (DUF2158 family)